MLIQDKAACDADGAQAAPCATLPLSAARVGSTLAPGAPTPRGGSIVLHPPKNANKSETGINHTQRGHNLRFFIAPSLRAADAWRPPTRQRRVGQGQAAKQSFRKSQLLRLARFQQDAQDEQDVSDAFRRRRVNPVYPVKPAEQLPDGLYFVCRYARARPEPGFGDGSSF